MDGAKSDRSLGSAAAAPLPSSMFSSLQSSLHDVCSFHDLKQRMSVYLSLGCCNEIFQVMTLVTKNIDDGRLRMRAHCPIVTEVGMKEKAMRALMCYNPIWLRIGLFVIFGGDSLLPDGDVSSEQEIAFLKMVIEKQFFSHPGLAKSYAYNKLVDGIYRDGYFEALGNVVLKRFLLLVLMLDRAKSEGSLSIQYGIDGVDGGSPLLFTLQSHTKSSRQMLNDFLTTDVMHGEGDLLAHLVTVGYKVSYQQCPLVEYDFRLTNLFPDLRDGVRLCRAVQLLLHDSSILSKMLVPSDTHKKNLVNCATVIQYLKQSGMPLYDEDGMIILGEDLVNGDKELTLSLLWNMFVHLQLPLLIDKTLFFEEIYKIQGVDMGLSKSSTSTLEILLTWIQAIGKVYDIQVDSFASLVDGKVTRCLLNYYFQKELQCSCAYKDASKGNGNKAIVLDTDNTYAVHKSVLSQKCLTLLGNFPEVLQISETLQYNGACNDRSVVIFLAFISSQMVMKKNVDLLNCHNLLSCKCQSLDRKPLSAQGWSLTSKAVLDLDKADEQSSKGKFKVIQAWWEHMDDRNNRPAASTLHCVSTGKDWTDIQEKAATSIQSHHRGLIERRCYLRIKNSVALLQPVILAWLKVKQLSVCNKFSADTVKKLSCERLKQSEMFRQYDRFMVDRHGFVNLRRATLLIQQAGRTYLCRRQRGVNMFANNICSPDLVNAASTIQTCFRKWMARRKIPQIHTVPCICQEKDLNDLHIKAAACIQKAWQKYIIDRKISSATKIQCVFWGWLHRRSFLNQKRAALKIQAEFRCFSCSKAFKSYKVANRSAIIIQSHLRQWIAERKARTLRKQFVTVQRHCHAWIIRKRFLLQRKAAIKIQSVCRGLKYRVDFQSCRRAAVEVQSFIRGQNARNRLLGASSLSVAIHGNWILKTSKRCFQSFELRVFLHSVLKLQRWWKGVLLRRSKTKAATIIQSHIRGWIALQKAKRERQIVIQEAEAATIIQSHVCAWIARQKAEKERQIVMIQSYWKGYLARKKSVAQLSDLRFRVQKSATNVKDDDRLINRLVVALSELQGTRSISCILHTCETLDTATTHSQKCCEELVAAGAINNLLKLICSLSRSIPDQEVLKHALSVLKNLGRYPHLLEQLIDNRGTVETILWEFIRNKQEGYFIASELLRKIFSKQKGVEAVRKLPSLRMLHKLTEELTRKATNKKSRSGRGSPAKGQTERRLKEASDILNMINVPVMMENN